MATQGSAAADDAAAPATFDALPLPLALHIFALLPADARLRSAVVCRAWRALLADPALWTRLDLSKAGGVTRPSGALLRAAAARAGGRLEVLKLHYSDVMTFDTLLPVVAANAGTLRELVLHTDVRGPSPNAHKLTTLLRTAPALRLLETGFACHSASALPLLRKEPPFGPLCLKSILLSDAEYIGWPAGLRLVADGLAAHTSLETVILHEPWLVAQAMDAVVRALASLQRLHTFVFSYRSATLPLLIGQLLACCAFKSVQVYGYRYRDVSPLLDSLNSAALLLCDVLHANTQLDTLTLSRVHLWHDLVAAKSLLSALKAHPSLRNLNVSRNVVRPKHAAAAGAALAALIAHSPALETLDITGCALGDAGLGPIYAALPHAQRLHTLRCDGNLHKLGRRHLLRAVRSGATLEASEGSETRKAQDILLSRARDARRF